jgi:hypothetical protein
MEHTGLGRSVHGLAQQTAQSDSEGRHKDLFYPAHLNDEASLSLFPVDGNLILLKETVDNGALVTLIIYVTLTAVIIVMNS